MGVGCECGSYPLVSGRYIHMSAQMGTEKAP